MGITIVICTHNRAALLERTLNSLNGVPRPEDCEMEILVVANACTDSTASLLDAYAEHSNDRGWLPLRWTKEQAIGKSNALNCAIPLIRTPVMAFVDDDHRVDENYLVALCRSVSSHRDATMFCGRILPDWDGEEPAWVHEGGPYAVYPLPIPRYEHGDSTRIIGLDGPIPGGGNLFLRREVFDRVGGFTVGLGPKGHNLSGGEDMDFILRALKSRETLRYVPSVVQYHYVDTRRLRLDYILRKSFLRSQSLILINLSSPGLPPRYLWRKLLVYFLHTVTSLYWPEVRFYLIRTAAALGEMSAYMRRS